MGSPKDEMEGFSSEGPQHEVTVPSFYMGKYAVTQRQWRAVSQLGFDIDIHLSDPSPSSFEGDELPVEQVNWHEAVEFCKRLSKRTGDTYRLPSEAEWEYACRAGTDTPFYFGETLSTDQANYGESRNRTTKVGSFLPNKFGLYDMHGNVGEWCQDVAHDDYGGRFSDKAPSDGSAWIEGGNSSFRRVRGGNWRSHLWHCRSGSHTGLKPHVRSSSLGFRVCCSVPST